ncbi:MAG: L-seryl-tRNA(Sec) selenium transferase [Anaerolineaceae bacterium]|nr:L-seryl-tRNA(Sec) selenium transferase [Anaerolineaceae bacterium]
MTNLSEIPSVDSLLINPKVAILTTKFGRSLTLSAIRSVLQSLRDRLNNGQSMPVKEKIVESIQLEIEEMLKSTLEPVINASGVILHTNLGRAPLSKASIQAIADISCGYSSLEFDLGNGKRGSRLIHAEKLLQQLTGAEAAVVVNNNAGAVMLTLAALANRKKVIISRTQMVEIGGGFRIPDVMRQSGAKLVEIGTTNRVHLSDYEKAIEEGASFILIAHHSNFKLIGFSSEPEINEIASLAHAHNIPVIHDLGSGALLNTENYGLTHEVTVQDSINADCDLICFSGDKLLGGPQAGIIIGKQVHLTKIRKHPLARALRADKLCLAALSATLTHYLKDEAESHIPIWQMLSQTPEQLRLRVQNWIGYIGTGEIIQGKSTTGGGSLPEEELATYLFVLNAKNLNQLVKVLRQQTPPIIARIMDEQVVLDPRTVLPFQEAALMRGLTKALLHIKDR